MTEIVAVPVATVTPAPAVIRPATAPIKKRRKTKLRSKGFVLKRSLDPYLDELLKGVTEEDGTSLRERFGVELRALIETWQHAVEGVRKSATTQLDEATKRKKIRDALYVLAIDPPRNGEIRSLRTKIRHQYRALSRLYHPDVSHNPDHQKIYQAVMEAYETLQVLIFTNNKPRESK